MKLPFFKKSKPAPAPEAPAAPRAPFPFAAPEQDEPVPAIHIDARVLAFLREYGAAPDQLDTQELTDALLAAMQRGLRGEAGGLPMLPAYLAPHGHVSAPEGKRVAVIDAGGTNFRVATVHYEFGQPILEDERTLPMPGSERDADWMDFIRLAADALEPLLDRVTQIGICFSYPAENTPELDAKVLGMTKEVQLTGWEDHLVGADLAEELERRGCTKLPITVINDTPATYLSGSTTIANNYANGFAGLVNGTGTNTCCLLPVRAIEKLGRDADGEMLVNLESGSFTDVPQSAFDKALDAASAAPGAYRFEKMTSGRYLGKLSRLALIAAAKDGLFAPETADKLRALDVLTAADADAFGADPDCGRHGHSERVRPRGESDRRKHRGHRLSDRRREKPLPPDGRGRRRVAVSLLDAPAPGRQRRARGISRAEAPALLRVQARTERFRHRHGRRVPAAGLIQGRKSRMSQTSGFLRLSGDDLTNMAQNHAMSGETFASGPCSFPAPFRTCGFI